MKFFQKHINHEELSFKELFMTFHNRVFFFVGKKVTGRENILDITQNVFIHLWQYRASLNGSDTENIIFKTCTQKIAEYYRKNAKLQTSELSEVQHADNSNDDLILLEEKEEHLLALELALEDLIPPIRREIFKMNKLQGITQKQISIQLNMPKRTVEHHISQSLTFLKNRLNFLKNS